MPTIADRKRAELDAKVESLEQDFRHWRSLAAVGVEDSLALHFRQIQCLIGEEVGALEQLRLALLEPVRKIASDDDAALLKKGPAIEKTVLAAHALWAFFREKFAQRLDRSVRPFLDAVSELAWACYLPARIAANSMQEQPLVYLSANWSPFMIGRGKRWSAADIGNFADEEAFAEVLQSLPLSVISVPMVEIGYVPDGIFVAHETGHAVEQDFKLGTELQNAVNGVNGLKDSKRWKGWCSEMFADAWATAHVGSAYVGALQDFVAPTAGGDGTDRYPPERVRVRLNREILRVLDLRTQADACHQAWTGAGLNDESSEWDASLGDIARALLETKLSSFGGLNVIDIATDPPVSAAGSHTPPSARDAAARAQAKDSKATLTEIDPRVLFAAMRICLEIEPKSLTGIGGKKLMGRFTEKLQPKRDTLRAALKTVRDGEPMPLVRTKEIAIAEGASLLEKLMAIAEAGE